LAAGTAVRTLQEFLKDHAWSYRGVRDTLQEHVAATLATLPADDLGTVGIVDETATVKKGTKTRGVQRQWCGERGKTEHGLRLRKGVPLAFLIGSRDREPVRPCRVGSCMSSLKPSNVPPAGADGVAS
jgi:hypothetical protein